MLFLKQIIKNPILCENHEIWVTGTMPKNPKDEITNIQLNIRIGNYIPVRP